MFEAWGRIIQRRRWLVLAVGLVAVALASVWGTGVFRSLQSSGGFAAPNGQSQLASNVLTRALGRDDADVVVLSTWRHFPRLTWLAARRMAGGAAEWQAAQRSGRRHSGMADGVDSSSWAAGGSRTVSPQRVGAAARFMMCHTSSSEATRAAAAARVT